MQNRMVRVLGLAAAAGMLLAGCASTPNARQAAMEARWQPVDKAWKASGQFLKPAPWKVGQWVLTGSRDRGKITGTSRMLIAAKDPKGWVVEITNEPYEGSPTVMQYLMLGYDEALKSGDFSKLAFGWMKMRDEDGTVRRLAGDEMAMYNLVSRQALDSMAVKLQTFVDGGALVVPAGSFPGSNRVEAKVKVFGFDVETVTWYHSSVPVNGVVKSATADGKTETVLLDFGFEGKPELPLD